MADSASDRLTKLEQAQKELAEKIKREKAKLRKEDRERENRRKLIFGDLVLRHYQENAPVKEWVEGLLDKELTANDERVLFGLKAKGENAPETAGE